MQDSRTRVAVIGRTEVVLPMQAAGVDVFSVADAGEVLKVAEDVIRQGYQVIFYTDDFSKELEVLVKRYSRKALPCLVALPWTGEKGEFDPLREAVRRAVGADVLGK